MSGPREFDGFEYDASDGTLRAGDDAALVLRPQVARLLECFLDRPGEVIPREELYRAVWGDDRVVDFESGLAALIKELRQAFRELGESAERIETVPRRGYRFHVFETPQSDPPVGGHTGRRAAVVALAALAVVAAALLAWRPWAAPSSTDGPPAAAILPFETFGTVPGPDHVSLLLADTFLAELWTHELEDLEIVGRTSLAPFAEGDDVAARLVEELGVALVFEGSVRPQNGGWRVEARLLALPDGRIAWLQAIESDAAELDVDAVAARLVDAFASEWPAIRERMRD